MKCNYKILHLLDFTLVFSLDGNLFVSHDKHLEKMKILGIGSCDLNDVDRTLILVNAVRCHNY